MTDNRRVTLCSGVQRTDAYAPKSVLHRTLRRVSPRGWRIVTLVPDTRRFIHELKLRDPSPRVERVLVTRLETARVAYNALLTELLRRDRLMRESVEYQRLRAELAYTKHGTPRSTNPRTVTFASNTERSAAWRALRKRFRLDGSYCLAGDVKQLGGALKLRSGANGLHVTLLHELARRAWEAYEPYLLHKRSGPGYRGAPRRRRWDEPLTTLSTRSTEKNHGPLRYDVASSTITWRDARRGCSPLTLRAMVDASDVVARYALATRKDGALLRGVCQVRIGYRMIRGRRRWFAQLVLEGAPYCKPRKHLSHGSVGVDVGAKHIAVVAPAIPYAAIETLNENVARSLREQATIERRRARAQDRSRRATNPDAFDDAGRYIRGKRIAVRSRAYRELGAQRKEAQRRASETKRQQNNALANRIITLGTSFHLEDLRYRAWQAAGMGRSMLASTPGAFVGALRAVAGKYTRDVVLIDARRAKLSQRCPTCDVATKTPIRGAIASRQSTCVCGRAPAQRDLLAAFLAAHCDASGTLDVPRVRSTWAGLSTVLAVATSRENQPTSAVHAPQRDDRAIVTSELVAAEQPLTLDAGACEVGAAPAVFEAARDRQAALIRAPR